MKYILSALLLFGIILSSCTEADQAKSRPDMGQAEFVLAPNFSGTDQSGATISLADLKGKVVVVNFWATWCKPCVAEMPEFVALQNEFGTAGVQFIGVSEDIQGMEIVLPFLNGKGINYPIIADKNDEIGNLYGGINALPTTFVINQQGEIIKKVVGMMGGNTLRPIFSQLLGGEAPAVKAEVHHIDPAGGKAKVDAGATFIDVRTPPELVNDGAYPGASNLPVGSLAASQLPVDKSAPIVFACRSGGRSSRAAAMAISWGYTDVYSIDGGIGAWKRAGLATN